MNHLCLPLPVLLEVHLTRKRCGISAIKSFSDIGSHEDPSASGSVAGRFTRLLGTQGQAYWAPNLYNNHLRQQIRESRQRGREALTIIPQMGVLTMGVYQSTMQALRHQGGTKHQNAARLWRTYCTNTSDAQGTLRPVYQYDFSSLFLLINLRRRINLLTTRSTTSQSQCTILKY